MNILNKKTLYTSIIGLFIIFLFSCNKIDYKNNLKLTNDNKIDIRSPKDSAVSTIQCRYEMIFEIDKFGNNKYKIFCDNLGQTAFTIKLDQYNNTGNLLVQTIKKVVNTNRNNVLIHEGNARLIISITDDIGNKKFNVICKSEPVSNRYSQHGPGAKDYRISCDYQYPVIIKYKYRTYEYCSNEEIHDGKYCYYDQMIQDTITPIIKPYIDVLNKNPEGSPAYSTHKLSMQAIYPNN